MLHTQNQSDPAALRSRGNQSDPAALLIRGNQSDSAALPSQGDQGAMGRTINQGKRGNWGFASDQTSGDGQGHCHRKAIRAGVLAIALVSLLVFSAFSGLAVSGASDGERALRAIAQELSADAGDLLFSEALMPGESVSDWIAFSCARAGLDAGRAEYLKRLEDEVTRRYREEGGLSDKKATEWQRIALTVMALEGDPTAFGSAGDGTPIDLIAEGTYGWDRADSFDVQGLNAWIFALLTLDARAFAVPTGARFTREEMLEHILSAQDASGGFGLSGGADVDITAMALQALAPYREKGAKEAVDRALAYLSKEQDAQGSIGGCAESTAQVIVALCSLSIDPSADARFQKEGGNVLDGLRMFRTDSGLYSHTAGGEGDLFATKEALLAWVAKDRMSQGMRPLFALTEMPDDAEQPLYRMEQTRAKGAALILAGVAVLLAGTVFVIYTKMSG